MFVGFGESGVENIDEINKTVVVVVVERVVHTQFVRLIDGIHNEVSRVGVQSVRIVSSVGSHFMWQFNRSDDIKNRNILPVGLCAEILSCASCRPLVVVVERIGE